MPTWINELERINDSINGLGAHSVLEVASWVAQIVLAVLAMISAYFVYAQVKELAAESARQTKQMKASFLFELDKLYEGEAFIRSRMLFSEHRDRVRREIDSAHGHLSHVEKDNLFSVKFSGELYSLRSQNPADYHSIMKFAGFFETASHLVSASYVEKADIDDLYSSSIRSYFGATRIHIIRRRQDENDQKIYENFYKLGEGYLNQNGAR